MYPKAIRLTMVWTLVLLATLMASLPVWAQAGSGFRETFDDPTLPEWEHSREAVISDGVLKLTPGSFALRFGDWSDTTLTARLRFTGEGEVFINYYFRDEGKYGLMLGNNRLILEKEQNRTPSPLGNTDAPAVQPNTWIELKIVVSGGQHQIYIDDELQLSATDPEPLTAGAVMLNALGELTAEFDSLELQGTAAEPRPPEDEPRPLDEGEPPIEEGEPGPEPEVPAGAVLPLATPTTQPTDNLVDEFFGGQANNTELITFAINMGLAAICAYILALVYIHWGSSLTNRRKFASNFMLMTVTTTFIILVVRSSVALSLGLVGALSIVRFRTAVKEPEELAYLFFAIGLGIGLGDNQRLLTLVALAGGIVIIGLLRLLRRSEADVNLHLTVASHNPHKIELEQIMTALKPHTAKLKLLRFDETAETLEAAFLVEFRQIDQLNEVRAAIKQLSPAAEITFLDNKGIW